LISRAVQTGPGRIPIGGDDRGLQDAGALTGDTDAGIRAAE
jgi:hypothetical protein